MLTDILNAPPPQVRLTDWQPLELLGYVVLWVVAAAVLCMVVPASRSIAQHVEGYRPAAITAGVIGILVLGGTVVTMVVTPGPVMRHLPTMGWVHGLGLGMVAIGLLAIALQWSITTRHRALSKLDVAGPAVVSGRRTAGLVPRGLDPHPRRHPAVVATGHLDLRGRCLVRRLPAARSTLARSPVSEHRVFSTAEHPPYNDQSSQGSPALARPSSALYL